MLQPKFIVIYKRYSVMGLTIMRDEPFEIETDPERDTQEPARKPWRTPQIIVAKADGAENASNLPDDTPFSVS